MRVMWGKKGDGGFLRVLNLFFQVVCPEIEARWVFQKLRSN